MRDLRLRVLSLACGLAGTFTCSLTCVQSRATELDSPDDIADTLVSHAVVRGKFSQLRELPGLPDGLRSEGEFTFWREHGIHWATLHPVQRQVTYRSDRTLTWSSGGALQTLNSPRDKLLRRLLMTVFSFDFEQLEEDFSSHWSIDGDYWGLTLTPRSGAAGRFLESITLGGGDTLSSLRVASHNGEVLSVQFRQVSSPDGLTNGECIAKFAYSPSECAQLLNDNRP